MTWAEFMRRAHERPLPLAVLEDLDDEEEPLDEVDMEEEE